jgi:hypothetical protein
MSDYKPKYQPLYPLMMSSSQSHSQEVGTLAFKRLEAVGDIRAKHITPKDTEIAQVGAKEGSKTFKKYFLANQFRHSLLQNPEGNDGVNVQILDEYQKYFDELVFLGEGTADNNVKNNGVFWSGDDNHITNSSYEVLEDANDNYLADLHTKIVGVASDQADLIAGRKALLVYGTSIQPLFDSLYPASQKPFKAALAEVLGANYSMAKMPAGTYASGANGFLIVNLDQIKFHYAALPALMARGVNEESMYEWNNFLMGSAMVDVIASGGIIKQPLTLSAL